MSAARYDHLASAARLHAAVGSETAGAALAEMPSASPTALAASTIKDIFFTVENTADGRFVVMAPDRLTVMQYFSADDMLAADAYACELNLPIWLALRPKGLVGYEPPAPDPADTLLELLDRVWRYEDGPPLPPVVRERLDVAEWVNP